MIPPAMEERSPTAAGGFSLCNMKSPGTKSVPCAIIYFMVLIFLKFFLFIQVYSNIYIKLSTKSDVTNKAVIISYTQGTTKCLITVSQYLGRWHGRGWFADTGGATQMFFFVISSHQSHLVRILYITYKAD